MELATLSSTKYANFYAPSYAIRLGGDDVMRDLLMPISEVSVDLELGALSTFSFTVANSYSHKLQLFKTGRGADVLDILKFGAQVEICMGYGDARSMPTILHGVIKEFGINFPEDGSPDLTVSGTDHSFLLSLGQHSRTWTNALYSDAVHEIAGYNNLGGSAIQTTSGKESQIEQNNESDWAFLEKIAIRNHFELYIDEQKALNFAPPNDKAAPIVNLVYGEGLLSFRPEANLSGQVSEVQLYGWDPSTKKQIVGRARAGEESGLTGKSGGQYLDEAFVRDSSKRPTLRLRQPVFTQAEADQRARAALNHCAKKFLKGEGEAIGLPELRPDRRVKLDNLGKLFSKTYYIDHANHKIDANGYRTRFNVKETGL